MDAGVKTLWEPGNEYKEKSTMNQFLNYVNTNNHTNMNSYKELWEWSVKNPEIFWISLADFSGLDLGEYNSILSENNVNARWFEGARVNYADRVYRMRNIEKAAIISYNEEGKEQVITYHSLWQKVSSLAAYFQSNGIAASDTVCAYIGNIPEAVITLLATASIGAIWSSCSPDFGIKGVIERFSQISPKVLIVSPEYSYNGKLYDRTENAIKILKALPEVRIAITTGNKEIHDFTKMNSIPDSRSEFVPIKVEFSHPLWILYSSGTTGKPKAIVHGHGGILLEHLKVIMLHMNIKENSVFTWATTTGWMMWNVLVGGLLAGSTILLYDGSLSYPDTGILWKLSEKYGITHLGVSAAYIGSLMDSRIKIKDHYQLDKLEFIGSTGSPLSPDAFEFVYENIKGNVWLSSLSGGTDLCSAICLGSPTLPVYSGMLQCRGLGAHVEALDPDGKPVINEKGELAIMDPMPDMPVFFWNDPDKTRYYESYYNFYPGIWRHGDYISIDDEGRVIIYGRSDAILNRNGIRIGTGEIYSSLNGIEMVDDSIVIGYTDSRKIYRITLFVVLRGNAKLDDNLIGTIKSKIRDDLSPRHVPDYILQAPSVPYTLNGKKMEVPVRRILEGALPGDILNRDSVKNPDSLDYYVAVGKTIF
ncbi:acetoacetate--CoA ligase [Ferroplasma acidarmanus]|uniref:AMP-dependent synthetase/ligase domain-containing protein n=1 Tax=Ferroplasma acidarmanus Fer1 TaxID=333146 RepID=S0AL91_FERAC|nr:acetoacetate--CoA ligase [Ferroplasma acidarmanus]AGO60128.1 hypothetical protein FACI_IFERC00001G0148 [Ferroplasma acidarmanus Fer1]